MDVPTTSRLLALVKTHFSNIKDLPQHKFIVMKKKGVPQINFKLLEKHLDNYLSHWSKTQIKSLLDSADDAYYNGEAFMSDGLYDKIRESYTQKYPDSANFGHTNAPVHGEKIVLPVPLYSMDKVKLGNSQLTTFLNTYTNTKCIMSKLDGTSLLLDCNVPHQKRAYTRGNGTVGHDVSQIISHVKGLKDIDSNMSGYVRGELIVSKEDWAKVPPRYANARNFVSGVINRKTITPGELSLIQFVAYEYISKEPISIQAQLKLLTEKGFNVVYNKVYLSKMITEDKLPILLKQFKDKSSYEIDGIIIQDNAPYERNPTGNPKYAKAFKMDSMCESATTEVLEVIWEPSKNGAIKPVVKVKPIKLAGVTIQRATGYNASFIENNGIGKGSLVEIIRSGDVIPKIVNVVKKSPVTFPTMPYKWDANHTDIYLVNLSGNRDVALKQIEHFVTTLEIGFYKKGQIAKGYDVGITDCTKLVAAKQEDFLKIAGLKDKSASKIIGSIVSNCENVPIHKLAAATPYFSGLGRRRLALVVKNIPNFLELEDSILKAKIITIDSLSDKMAQLVIDGLPAFKKFLAFYQTIYSVNSSTSTCSSQSSSISGSPIQGKLNGRVFVFSGIRDKELEKQIEELGGEILPNITSKGNVTDLIVKDVNSTSSKVVNAKKKGITINDIELFKNSL
uniref:DNA ligase (NAD(+)) n=1 Tax=viral metagenome TaxID=1070528 RepID=A0A6C0JC93_9ZZZZ